MKKKKKQFKFVGLSGKKKKNVNNWQIALALSLFICVIMYFLGNKPYSRLNNIDPFYLIQNYLIQGENDSIREHIFAVNTHDDKVSVKNNGNISSERELRISDRQKLLRFLSIADSLQNYSCIFFDIALDEDGVRTEYDDSISALIARMPRIIITKTKDSKGNDVPLLNSSQIAPKAAYNELFFPFRNSTVSYYQYIQYTEKSVPLVMYEYLYPERPLIKQLGPIYWCGVNLCCNSPFLRINESFCTFNRLGEKSKFVPWSLGELLSTQDSCRSTGTTIEKMLPNQIIVIGDFDDLSDMYSTYMGSVSGAMLACAALENLVDESHIISWKLIVFEILLYFFIGWMILSRKDFIWMDKYVRSNIVSFMMSFLSLSLLLTIISSIAYYFGAVISTLFPAFCFSLLNKIRDSKIFNI